MQNFSAIGFFCDDIREEKSGVHTIVGVLGDNINVPGFPGTMPKLAIYVRIRYTPDSVSEKLSIFLNLPNGERTLINTIEEEFVAGAIREAKDLGSPIPCIFAQMVASNFPVPQAGRILLELESSSGRELLAGLNFVQSDSAPSDPTASPPPFAQSPPAAPAS